MEVEGDGLVKERLGKSERSPRLIGWEELLVFVEALGLCAFGWGSNPLSDW